MQLTAMAQSPPQPMANPKGPNGNGNSRDLSQSHLHNLPNNVTSAQQLERVQSSDKPTKPIRRGSGISIDSSELVQTNRSKTGSRRQEAGAQQAQT